MSSNGVPETILQQLGGRRFIAMTGARDFIGDRNVLMFRLPNRTVNRVEIRLDPSDTYTVSTYRVTAPCRSNSWQLSKKKIAECSDVYCDNLQTIFTKLTGLDTHL